MRTRRVRRAIYKIANLLIQDGVKKDSHLWKTWTAFVDAFIKEYRAQWIPPKNIKRPRMGFRAKRKKK
jgi:hypothetical protein